MKKFADERKSVDVMSLYVAFTRALYLVHQQNHWESKSYDFHLLLQRIYESTQEMSDDAAEKTIGIFGELTKQDKISSIAAQFSSSKFGDDKFSVIKSSLAGEEAFQKFATHVYKTLKESGDLTLGMDDLIMSQVSKSELHTYLLKQVLKG
jgi:DNA-binding ferritin-like protein